MLAMHFATPPFIDDRDHAESALYVAEHFRQPGPILPHLFHIFQRISRYRQKNF